MIEPTSLVTDETNIDGKSGDRSEKDCREINT